MGCNTCKISQQKNNDKDGLDQLIFFYENFLAMLSEALIFFNLKEQAAQKPQ